MESMGRLNAGNTPVRQTVASDILEQAEKLVSYSGQVAARTEDRLHSVLRQGEPTAELKKIEVARSYPPLFDTLRDKLDQIEQSLKSIGETLDRVES